MSVETEIHAGDGQPETVMLPIDEVIDLMLDRLSDGADHPELWPDFPEFLSIFPTLGAAIEARLRRRGEPQLELSILLTIAKAASGDAASALAMFEPIATAHSQSPLVQGVTFYLQSLLDPANPKYDLADRFCDTPFHKFDVLDGSTHLCCASWLTVSAGNLEGNRWQDVWNSAEAQAVRESIHDGSFRYCNKTACPLIASGTLPSKAEIAERIPARRQVIEEEMTVLPRGPERVTLAYDRTCNLSCPSCRTEKYAADSATRARFDQLQEEAILPMLRDCALVDITGSGDPFASKNFRRLIEQLGPEDYPDLRFQVMTNAMLLTRREWDRFPALHNRVKSLRISLDAATGPTHELIRRGARWAVMLENLAFAQELRRAGLVDHLDFIFIVQAENFREMGDFVDLGHRFGVDAVKFFRMTNWGTFSAAEFAAKAVFMPAHADHGAFVGAMQDRRLRDPLVDLNDLMAFVRDDAGNAPLRDRIVLKPFD